VDPVIAHIGLGGNLDGPAEKLRLAIDELRRLALTRLVRASSLYRSAPLGNAAQPDFINAVAEVSTALAPRALLDALLAIEARYGRVRTFADAPRTLDLDLLLYDARVIGEPGLHVPHPRMHERAFVLAPLVEIAPDCVIPGRGLARDWLARLADQQIEKLESP
jgi:2-amino-4-hydroxy-6-hydroxymethyldihydropteridine diphosphokinase